MKFVVVFLLFFSLNGDLVVNATAQDVFSWDDCLKEAKIKNPDLISAAQVLKQVEADKRIAQSVALPQVNSSLLGKKSKSAASTKQGDTYSYSVTAGQLLFDGFKTVNDIIAAEEDVKASSYNYKVASSNVRLNVRIAFVELLWAQELVLLTEDIAKRRKQNLELVRLRYEAGREHKGALLTAQADLAQADLEIEQAKRNLSLSQTKLIKAVGWERHFAIKVVGSFVVSDSGGDNLDFVYLADSTPFLKELISKKEAARFNLKSAKADFFPQIYANGSIGKSDSSWPPGNNRKEWSTSLSVSFPLFEGGSRFAKISKQQAKINQAQVDQRSGRDSVVVALEETWVNLQDAIGTAIVQKKFFEAALERAKIASSQYSSGLIGFDDWIIIEDNLVSAKKSYLNAQASMLIAEAKWIQAKGGTLEYVQK